VSPKCQHRLLAALSDCSHICMHTWTFLGKKYVLTWSISKAVAFLKLALGQPVFGSKSSWYRELIHDQLCYLDLLSHFLLFLSQVVPLVFIHSLHSPRATPFFHTSDENPLIQLLHSTLSSHLYSFHKAGGQARGLGVSLCR
jgi:hypothetical protein